jgi:stage II sporulation protein R
MTMKKLAKISTYVLSITLLLSVLPTDAEANIYEDTIRLHILANSDSKEDQALKISVRDGLLLEYGERLRSAGSFEGAAQLAENLLSEIESFAEELINAEGYEYNVTAILSEEWYETRDYDDFSLPCGIYTSLRILIGEGKGKNWWCVMYPPLCTELACEDAPADDGFIDYTKEELILISGSKYNLKFKILEDLSRVFSKNS